MNEVQEDLNDAVKRISEHATRTSQIRAWLTFLHYDVNKQHTNVELQQTWTGQDGEIMWGKRRNLHDVLFDDDVVWLSTCTNRTLFSNEIVLDIDPHPNETPEQFKQRISNGIEQLKKTEDTPFLVWSTGSRGIHIHLYDRRLSLMEPHTREQVREVICKKYQAERKISDNVPIMMEWSNHRKTGIPKKSV